jgi:hypothetical protein
MDVWQSRSMTEMSVPQVILVGEDVDKAQRAV